MMNIEHKNRIKHASLSFHSNYPYDMRAKRAKNEQKTEQIILFAEIALYPYNTQHDAYTGWNIYL